MDGGSLTRKHMPPGLSQAGEAAAHIADSFTDPRDWPPELVRAFKASLVEEQYREMRFLTLVGLAVNIGSVPIDLAIMSGHAMDMLLMRAGLVLPFQLATLLMPIRHIGWQKLLAGLSLLAFCGVLLIGTQQWAPPATAAFLAMGPVLVIGVIAPVMPYSPRESAAFGLGSALMLLAAYLLMDNPVLRNPAFVGIALITIIVSVILPRRMWALQGRNFLLSMQSQNRLQSLGETNARLVELTRKDPLTGLANRRHATEVFASHHYAQPVEGEARVAVLMLDIDRFKEFNDYWGHQAGDACLIAASEEMRHLAARYSGLAARFGGEEFVIILRTESRARARETAEELRRAIERIEIAVPERQAVATCTASIGIAVHDGKGAPDLSKLLSAADNALYLAKDKGRNRSEMAA